MKSEAYQDLLAKSDQHTVLIAFTASWSGASQMLMHKLTAVAEESDLVIVGELDIDQHESLVANLSIQQVPTTFIVRDRVVVDLFTGTVSKNMLLRKLSSAAEPA